MPDNLETLAVACGALAQIRQWSITQSARFRHELKGLKAEEFWSFFEPSAPLMFSWDLEISSPLDAMMVWQIELRKGQDGWQIESWIGWNGEGRPIEEFVSPVDDLGGLPGSVRVTLEHLESCNDAILARFKDALSSS